MSGEPEIDGGTEVKKLVIYASLGILGWLGLSTAWAVTARATGFPGPAQSTYATMDAAADALESLDLPAPLAASRHVATRQIRSSGRALTRIYAVPERLAARLLGARGHWHGDRWHAAADGASCRASAVAGADAEAEVARRIESLARRLERLGPRMEARIERIEVVPPRIEARIEALAPRIEEEIARELEARLEQLHDAEIRIQRAEQAISLELSGLRFER